MISRNTCFSVETRGLTYEEVLTSVGHIVKTRKFIFETRYALKIGQFSESHSPSYFGSGQEKDPN